MLDLYIFLVGSSICIRHSICIRLRICICPSISINSSTLVGDYIKTKKTTFDLNFDLYEAVKQHGYK